jgi:hypothetical protein
MAAISLPSSLSETQTLFGYSIDREKALCPDLSLLVRREYAIGHFDHFRLNGHLLGWKPCKLLNAIALGQIKAMNKKTAFTAGLK